MKDFECKDIPAEDRVFLEYLEKCFAQYPNRKVAARFGVGYDKRRLAGLGPGRLLRYRRLPGGEGFVAEGGSRDEIMQSPPPGDPCCEWAWDEETQSWVCLAWC